MLIHDYLHAGNPYLAGRLKSVIEEYKGYHSNTLIRKPEDDG